MSNVLIGIYHLCGNVQLQIGQWTEFVQGLDRIRGRIQDFVNEIAWIHANVNRFVNFC